MKDDIGEKDASIKVESNVPVIPERAMYRNDRREGHDSIGTTTPANDFYLAEGTTAWGFATYVLVQNPNNTTANITVSYMTPTGSNTQPPFQMSALSRKTIKVNDFLPNTDLSTWVHADQPIVAERAMYWTGSLGEACHDSIGVSSAAKEWYLAEGSTNGGFETWVLIQNPNDSAAAARITYMTPAGSIQGPSISLAPRSRQSINIADTVPNEWGVSTKVESGQPLIVERSVYWNSRNGGHESIGVTGPSTSWYLAEGSTNGGFETWVLIQNPNDSAATAQITYMTPAGAVPGPSISLARRSRQSVNVADTVPNEWSVSTQVESGQPLIVERSVYWSQSITPTPQPQPTGEQFNSEDYPTTLGYEQIFYTEDPYSGITYDQTYPVSFTLQGPWDFSSGPTEGTAHDVYIPVSSVPESIYFPGASIADRYNDGLSNSVDFSSKDASALLDLGGSYQNMFMDDIFIEKYEQPVTVYRFPFRVGDSWVSRVTYSDSGFVTDSGILVLNARVVSKNSIKVPQGSYQNCFMIQFRVQDTSSDGTTWNYINYAWVVPGIGLVAAMGSVDGEQYEVYTQATYFHRLKEVKLPGGNK